MAKQKGMYVVVPAEQEDGKIDGKDIGGIAFPKAGQATQFVENVQAYARREAAKLLGLTVDKDDLETMSDDEKKEAKEKAKTALAGLPQVLPLDVLIQRLDADNQPDGDPIEYETYRD